MENKINKSSGTWDFKVTGVTLVDFRERVIMALFISLSVIGALFKFFSSQRNKTIKDEIYLTEEDLTEELMKL